MISMKDELNKQDISLKATKKARGKEGGVTYVMARKKVRIVSYKDISLGVRMTPDNLTRRF